MKTAQLTARLAEVRSELAAVRKATAAPTNPGCSKLRGKQHDIRINAAVHRTAQAFEKVARLDMKSWRWQLRSSARNRHLSILPI